MTTTVWYNYRPNLITLTLKILSNDVYINVNRLSETYKEVGLSANGISVYFFILKHRTVGKVVLNRTQASDYIVKQLVCIS